MSGASEWYLLHLAYANERVGNTEAAMAAYKELLDAHEQNGEALDRLAHLCFVTGDKREGAALAKRAAHLGHTTVFTAWSDGHYKRGGAVGRPKDTTPEKILQFPDTAWPAGEP